MTITRYRRRLPHIHISGMTYFLTFRLSPAQPSLLVPEERDAIVSHIQRMRPGKCQAFVVMPDHVHLLYQTQNDENLSKTLQSLKGASSHFLVNHFKRKAPIWQDETYDHLIRDERELIETWRYIEGNPVRKQIAPRIADYKWSSASKNQKVGESQSNSQLVTAGGGCATAGGGCATEGK
jgi:REP element-mobilizing transposase RayT